MKYVYDWANPSLASRYMTFGRVKASARKIMSGYSALTSPINHSQNANGFVCGLSTRKMRTPWPAQKRTTSSSAAHSAGQSSDSNSSG